jgi:hypothetical protein
MLCKFYLFRDSRLPTHVEIVEIGIGTSPWLMFVGQDSKANYKVNHASQGVSINPTGSSCI